MEPEEPTDSLFREEQDLPEIKSEIKPEPQRGPQGPSPAPSVVTMSREEYNALRQDGAEYKEKYLRSLAEMENARKRLMKERDENAQQAVIEVICDFLAPMDHMEHALAFAQQMSPEVKTWATGFEMILMQFKEVLSANGVTPIAALGRPFDPHFHEAIEAIETDEALPGTIIEECRPGYSMSKSKKLVRPSRVKIAKAPTPLEEEEEPLMMQEEDLS